MSFLSDIFLYLNWFNLLEINETQSIKPMNYVYNATLITTVNFHTMLAFSSAKAP